MGQLVEVNRLHMLHAAILGAVADGPSLFFDDIGRAEGRIEWRKALFDAGGRLEALEELVKHRKKPDGDGGTERFPTKAEAEFLKKAEAELEHMQAEKAILFGTLDLELEENDKKRKLIWRFRRNYSRVMSNRTSIVALDYIYDQEDSVAQFKDIAIFVIRNITPDQKDLRHSDEAYFKTILDQLKDLTRWGIVRLGSLNDGEIFVPYWPGDGIKTQQIYVSGTDLGLRFLDACRAHGERLVSRR